jgi:Double zinc ribbon
MVVALTGSSGFFGALHDFFGSGTWPVFRNLLIFLLVVFWLAVGYWVYKDARRRIEDPWLVGAATVLGLIPPFIGTFIYMLFRPPEYLEDVRERELEIKAMEESLGRGTRQHCPVCRAEIDENFLVCPVCTTRLRQSCTTCKAPLEPLWQVCPYCETPIESSVPIHFPPLESPRSETGSE